MKTPAFVLATALLFSAAAASAQSFVSSADPDQPVGNPRTAALGQSSSRSYTRTLSNGSSLTCFEAVSSRDSQHEQYAQLRHAFEKCKPALVLYQWFDNGVDSTEAGTIKRTGEAGYARFLAQEHGVPAQRFDSPVAEYEHLKATTDAEQLKLYYLLYHTQRLRKFTGTTSKAQALRIMQQLMTNSAYFLPGTEQVIRNRAELEAAYRKYCPNGGKWWELPASCFTPGAPASQTGQAFANINRALGEYRAQQLNSLVTEKTQAGQKVLVVVAPGYLPAAK